MSGSNKQEKSLWSNAGKWLAGIAATVIAGLLLSWLTPGQDPDPTSIPPTERPPSAEATDTPTVTEPKPAIWQEGTLTLPVSGSDSGQAADLDAGNLLMLGTSVPVDDADILVRQSPHSIVIEPGLSRGDGITFEARFTEVNDASVGQAECTAATISSKASNHLQLFSDIDVGSHICMVTTQGRVAEFEIINTNFSGSSNEVEIAFIVWARDQ